MNLERTFNLRFWEFFVAVASEGSASAAADKLGVSQPSVSQGLKKLEQHLGLKLLVRRHDGIELTHTGHSLLPQARILISDAIELSTTARLLAQQPGAVRLGFAESVPPIIATAVTAEMTKIEGYGQIRAHTASVQSLVEQVHSGRIHAAVIEDPSPTGDLLRGQLHKVRRVMVGVNKISELQGRIMLDNTARISSAAADRLADALFTLGISPEIQPWASYSELAARLGAGDTFALLTPDVLSFQPRYPMAAGFSLRLRTIVAASQQETPSGRDLRSLIDAAIRKSIRELEQSL